MVRGDGIIVLLEQLDHIFFIQKIYSFSMVDTVSVNIISFIGRYPCFPNSCPFSMVSANSYCTIPCNFCPVLLKN